MMFQYNFVSGAHDLSYTKRSKCSKCMRRTNRLNMKMNLAATNEEHVYE